MKDRVATMQWIYPETSLFFLSLISGGIGLFVVLIISLRRPDAPLWVIKVWPYCRTLMVVALLFDLIINSLGFFLLAININNLVNRPSYYCRRIDSLLL
jgi:hypothetical protein